MEGAHRRQQIIHRYQELEINWYNRLIHLKKQSHYIAGLRLALFVASFALPFSFLESWSFGFWVTFLTLFFAFIGSVFYAHRLGQLKKEAETYLSLYRKELRIINNQWTEEPDGAEFIDSNHDYAHDLDLFGKGSLFQYLNRTATKEGYRKLASKLNTISVNIEDLKSKQEAIKELSIDTEFREQLYVKASMVEEGLKKKKELNLNHQPDLSFVSGGFKYVVLAFPVFAIIIFVLAFLKLIPSSSILYLFFGGLLTTGRFLRKINMVHNEVSTLGRYLSHYSTLIRLVEDLEINAPYLKTLKAKLNTNGKSASEIVKQLGKRIQYFDQRLNMLMGAILNGFFLWDLVVCVALKQWYSRHGSQLIIWMHTLNEFEALNSFGTFTYNHPESCWPEFSSNIIIETKELGHPLIPQEERVNNNFAIDGEKQISVVTGANMAGKSTFLRTIGVNLILAGNGCVVCATEFVYKPLTFITNMRAIDNLLKHESYFFAELSRLQMIMERLKAKGELFFILDEILKGTNSHDKTTGSMALIKQLFQLNGYGIVATHDLELGQLANTYPGKIINNCFEVSFEADELHFDYKLREGVTQSHNASFLMRKMGLIPKD